MTALQTKRIKYTRQRISLISKAIKKIFPEKEYDRISPQKLLPSNWTKC